MDVNTEKYIRKPLYVDAVRITAENFDDVVAWCQGESLTEEIPGQGTTKKYIKVRVHNPKNPRQTKAFVGDWLLYTERGYKVYTNRAFRTSFDPVETEAIYTDSNQAAGIVSVGEITSVESTGEITSVAPPVEIEATLERAPVVSDSDSAPPPQTEDGRRVLTDVEQREMDAEEVQALLRSGTAVLAQDLVG